MTQHIIHRFSSIFAITLTVLVFIFCTSEKGTAQYRSRTERIKGRQPIGREQIKCPLLIDNSKKPAIGVRIGDPIGISFKTYSKTLWSVEAVIGITYLGLGAEKSEEVFDKHVSKKFENTVLINQDIVQPFMGQLKVIRHFKIPGQNNLFAFAALGADLRYMKINYLYQSDSKLSAGVGSERIADLDDLDVDLLSYGPELQLGIEYYFKGLPFCIYAEGGIFYDIAGNFGFPKFIGGTGIRYYFH